MSKSYYSQLYDLTPDEYDNEVFKNEPFMKGEDMIEDTREDPAMDIPEWIPANNLDIDWRDCVLSFRCLCGRMGMTIDYDEPCKCPKCGRLYRLVVYVEVKNET